MVTSRSESKAMDDKKVDLIDTENKLPCNIQLKKTIKTPDYFSIRQDAPTNLPFCIIWNKQIPTEKTFRSAGEVVILPKDYFYELINNNK